MAIKSTLIVIHGAPASGKTHFSRWLSQQLQVPLLSKDDIKEELFNHFDYHTVQSTQNIGAASFDLLWLWLSKLMPFGPHLIIETAFFAKYNQPKINNLAQQYNYHIIQIFCQADENVRHQRYVDRANGPDRHPGHMDKQRLDQLVSSPSSAATTQYQAMDLSGTLLTLNTTDLNNLNYHAVLEPIKQELNHAD